MRGLLLPSAMHVCRVLLKAATDRQHEHEKLKANAAAKRPMASCVRVRKTRWCSGAALLQPEQLGTICSGFFNAWWRSCSCFAGFGLSLFFAGVLCVLNGLGVFFFFFFVLRFRCLLCAVLCHIVPSCVCETLLPRDTQSCSCHKCRGRVVLWQSSRQRSSLSYGQVNVPAEIADWHG